MARDQALLSSTIPIAIAPATPYIGHIQLRDLLICPRQKGLVNYVANRLIVEQDLHAQGAPSRILAKLDFVPNSFTSLQFEQNATLIAAGGQDAELHLSYHKPSTSSPRRSRLVWQAETCLTGSINNSVLLTSLNLTASHESSVEPRVVISNNDGSVKFYDVPMRVQSSGRKLQEVGAIKLDVPVNHSSISPDAHTLLSVGDSNKVYFHRISGGARLSFTPITTLSIPAPDTNPFGLSASSLVASFSTAFSRDGSKFAVASQEGVVAVWDVRSTKPIKVFHSDKSRGLGGRDRSMPGNGAASGWLSDDPLEWTRGNKAPGWCIRSVKFNAGDRARQGKEVMAFTEHTSVVHIVDALTFETHDIIRMPTIARPSPRHHLRQSSAPSIIVSSPDANASQSNSRSTLSHRWTREPRVPPSRNIRRASATSPEPILRRPPYMPPAGVTPAEESGPATSRSTASSSNPPGVVQALGDAFRIPTSAYSAPSSIGDSTWRTLDDEVHLGPVSRRRNMDNPTGMGARSIPFVGTPPMPSLHALANYVLEPENNARQVRDDVPEEMRGDEGALSRRIRREERALRRGMEFGNGLFEDEEGSGSDTTEYAPAAGSAVRNGVYPRERRQGRREDGIVVVPDLGDREVESEVHAALAVHGIQSRLARRRSYDDDEEVERRGSEVVDLDDGYGDDNSYATTETDRDTNAGSTHADYDYPLYGRRSRRRRGNGRLTITPADEMLFEETGPGYGRRRSRLRRGAGRFPTEDMMLFDEAEDAAAVERDSDNRMDVDDIREEEEEEEDEDEDTDCISNGNNSRSASPHSFRRSMEEPKFDNQLDYGFDDSADSGAYYSGASSFSSSSSSSAFPSSSSKLPNLTYCDDIDIAGMCFDPWGERLYVAGTGAGLDGINGGETQGLFSGAFGSHAARTPGGHGLGTVIEWGVRGAEKRFWVDEGWM